VNGAPVPVVAIYRDIAVLTAATIVPVAVVAALRISQYFSAGAYSGEHAVCCIGFDDDAKLWICKNSWWTKWGDGGFFRIGYGECGIGAQMWGLLT